MRRLLSALAILSLPLGLAACQPASRGKDYLKAHPQELAQVLRECADGTHKDQQECANAEDLKILDQKLRSLSK